MSILRLHRHDGGFTSIDNLAIQNRRLSLKARGLHHLLLSLPEGSPVDALTLHEGWCDLDGRDALQSGMRELERAGYLRRRREQGSDGKWRTFTDIYERPVSDSASSKSAGRTEAGFSRSGEAAKPVTEAGLTGAGQPRAMEKGRDRASPNGDGGSRRRDGRSDTLVGRCVEAMGGHRPVEIGAFTGIVSKAEQAGVPAELIARECRYWFEAKEPVAWLTNRLGQAYRRAQGTSTAGDERRRDGESHTTPPRPPAHDGRHDPACGCYRPPGAGKAEMPDLLAAAGLPRARPRPDVGIDNVAADG